MRSIETDYPQTLISAFTPAHSEFDNEFLPDFSTEKIGPTDNPLANVELLAKHRMTNGEYPTWVEEDVTENIMTSIAESNVTSLVAVVDQERDERSGMFMAFGNTTIGHAVIGEQAVKVVDGPSMNQKLRAGIELEDEKRHHEQDVLNRLSRGHSSVFISPSPSFSEMEPDVANERYGYDGRTMIRIQTVSSDQKTKYMHSASVFGLPIEAAQRYYRNRNIDTDSNTPALSIMRASAEDELYEGTPEQVLGHVLEELAAYCDEPTAEKLLEQKRQFSLEQDEMEDTVAAYAAEELAFSIELVESRSNSTMSGAVRMFLDNHVDQTSYHLTRIIESHRAAEGYRYSDDLAIIALSLKQEIIKNRASLALGDERVRRKFEAKLGRARTEELTDQEVLINNLYKDASDTDAADFIRGQTERDVAAANVGCEGGCPVALKDQFGASAKSARNQVGLEGTLYIADKSQLQCPDCNNVKNKGVLVDEHGSKFCLDCQASDVRSVSSQSSGSTGSVRRKAAARSKQRRTHRRQRLWYSGSGEERPQEKHWLQYAKD